MIETLFKKVGGSDDDLQLFRKATGQSNQLEVPGLVHKPMTDLSFELSDDERLLQEELGNLDQNMTLREVFSPDQGKTIVPEEFNPQPENDKSDHVSTKHFTQAPSAVKKDP